MSTLQQTTARISRASTRRPASIAPSRMDPASPPSLRYLSGPNAGRMVLLEKERLVLGRAESAELPTPGGAASREHAAITRSAAGWRLEDLKSRNGTLLN